MAGIQQNFSSRKDAINSLAEAFGAERSKNLGFEQKYDAATGTYYCHGKMYSRTLIEETKGYMYSESQKYSSRGAEWRDMALAYDLAYEAICRLTDADVNEMREERNKAVSS